MIYRRNLSELKTLGDGNHCGIDDTERKIEVVRHQFRHAVDVVVLESGDPEAFSTKRLEEGQFSVWPHSGLESRYPISPNWRGHQERTAGPAQQPEARLMGLILGVARGQKNASVTQQARVPYERNSAVHCACYDARSAPR